MLLSHRPATVDDFLAARDALAPWYGPNCPGVQRFWEGILGREGVWSLVIESLDGPPRPLSLSLSVFVSDRFADRVEAGRCPWIGGTLASRFLTKGDEPLSLEKIRAAHHGEGLNLLSVHTVALDAPLGNSSAGIVGDLRAKVCHEEMRGFRIKRCMRDVFSPQALRSFQAGGWRLRSDYAAYFEDEAKEPSLARPFLVGVNREEAAQGEAGGARMSGMFNEYPVRLGLRRVHRELLHAALDGLTDAELSERLSLSPSAVKKRWAAVYAHVEGKIPGLPPDSGRGDKTRGAERRRHVLNYVRDHAEEFRPLVD